MSDGDRGRSIKQEKAKWRTHALDRRLRGHDGRMQRRERRRGSGGDGGESVRWQPTEAHFLIRLSPHCSLPALVNSRDKSVIATLFDSRTIATERDAGRNEIGEGVTHENPVIKSHFLITELFFVRKPRKVDYFSLTR